MQETDIKLNYFEQQQTQIKTDNNSYCVSSQKSLVNKNEVKLKTL